MHMEVQVTSKQVAQWTQPGSNETIIDSKKWRTRAFWRFRGGSAMSPVLKPYGPISAKSISRSQIAPSWAEVGAKWVQVRPKLGPCRPKLIDRVQLDDFGPICKMCKIIQQSCTFWPGRTRPPLSWSCTRLTDPSIRRILINYHASAPSVHADLKYFWIADRSFVGVTQSRSPLVPRRGEGGPLRARQTHGTRTASEWHCMCIAMVGDGRWLMPHGCPPWQASKVLHHRPKPATLRETETSCATNETIETMQTMHWVPKQTESLKLVFVWCNRQSDQGDREDQELYSTMMIGQVVTCRDFLQMIYLRITAVGCCMWSVEIPWVRWNPPFHGNNWNVTMEIVGRIEDVEEWVIEVIEPWSHCMVFHELYARRPRRDCWAPIEHHWRPNETGDCRRTNLDTSLQRVVFMLFRHV